MIVITDIEVPADQFALGRLLNEIPDVKLELERLVPLQTAVIPLFWVEGASPDTIEETIRHDPITQDISHLTETGGRHLFEFEWSPDVDAIVQPLLESNASVLRAEGTGKIWEFRLQFTDRDSFSHFRRRCREKDITFELLRLYNPSVPRQQEPLTEPQAEILLTAYRDGYWDIPRHATLGDIAAALDISENAASERLRRAIKKAIAGTDLVTE